MTHRLLFIVLLGTLSTICANAQIRRTPAYEQYIETYKSEAIKQMREHKIPASITLAQGLLESAAGNSPLAKQSNNHFGIKCGSPWLGPSVRHSDDRKNECFRVYKTVGESYEDHSKFLERERYSRLFSLSTRDYKAWARGLKACGYATSPTYADKLIAIIEAYDLHKYDLELNDDFPVYIPEEPKIDIPKLNVHRITTNNDVMCVVANQQDTWESIAKELSMPLTKLLKINEASESIPLKDGDFVYLEKKQTKAAKQYDGTWHKVQKGESMFSISQKYAVRLKNLYKMNFKDADYSPMPGDLLKVR